MNTLKVNMTVQEIKDRISVLNEKIKSPFSNWVEASWELANLKVLLVDMKSSGIDTEGADTKEQETHTLIKTNTGYTVLINS